MFSPSMLRFLSKESIKAHIEYMNTQKHKNSVIEKSYPTLLGKSPEKLLKMHLPKDAEREVRENCISYLSHKCYFSSFAENDKPCPAVKKYYSSENALLYEVLELAKNSGEGFIYIFAATASPPRIAYSEDCRGVFTKYTPTLALDICEHAYFADYGFNRDLYLRNAVSRLDIAKLFSGDLT